ncbi:hypothetical protein HY251_06155 [bacterium]|nr:hypothetical protein [bacterium]
MFRPLSKTLLLVALTTGFVTALSLPLSADDKPSTATPKVDPKEEQKQKDIKKAREEIDKEWKAKKADPTDALTFFQTLVDAEQLDVQTAKDFYKKVMAKKIPIDQARAGINTVYVTCIDKKTQKYDPKKFVTDFAKWINDWKPPKEEKPADKK